MTTAWLEGDEAAKEFENIPDGWMEEGTNPEGWKPRTVQMESDNLLDGLQNILKTKEYTVRKKSLLKKQISDLKIYLDEHLPSIKEEEKSACEELPNGWSEREPRLFNMNG